MNNITLNTDFSEPNCGFGDEAPKRGQNWIVFVHRNQEDNRLHFGGMCEPSSRLEKASDISDFEKRIFSMKDNQAVVGSVVNDMKTKGIKNIEVMLEGERQTLTTQKDEKGLYYLPVTSSGKYKTTIKIPFPAMQSDSSFAVETTSIRENTSENARPLSSIITYEVQLKEGEFNCNEIKLFLLEPK